MEEGKDKEERWRGEKIVKEGGRETIRREGEERREGEYEEGRWRGKG